MWAMEGNLVEITLQKQDAMHWWSKVLETDQAINTQKVIREGGGLDGTELDWTGRDMMTCV